MGVKVGTYDCDPHFNVIWLDLKVFNFERDKKGFTEVEINQDRVKLESFSHFSEWKWIKNIIVND